MERGLARFSSPEREAVLNMGCKIEVALFVGRGLVPEMPEVEVSWHGFLGGLGF